MNINNLQPLQKLRPFARFCCTIGNLPSSYMESLTYEEQLLWFCDFLKNTVIPAVNNNAKAVEELQKLYVELQDYVNNYFNNLDVQEEINNKLDEMAQKGILADIIAEYIQLKGILTYNTIQEMKEATNLIEGCFVKTYGFYNLNDGGQAFYKVKKLTNHDDIDEMTLFALNNNSLVAELIADKEISIKQLGAKGDNEQNASPFIQKAVSNFSNIPIIIPSGTYLIDEPINIINAHTQIKGVGVERPIFKKISSKAYSSEITYEDTTFNFTDYPSIFNLIFPENNNITHVEIDGISLSSNENRRYYGIVAPHCAYSIFKNIRFSNFSTALILNGWVDKVDNCSFFTNNYGIFTIQNSYFITMKILNCYFNTSTLRINSGNCGIYNTHCDNGNPCFEFINTNINMYNCATETYSLVLRNTNSKVNIFGGNFEGHSSEGVSFGGFIYNQNNGRTYLFNVNLRYEDYAGLGEPSNKNIIYNTGGIVEFIGNINTPYEYTNFLSNTGYNKINEEVYSLTKTVPVKINKTITTSSKTEIFRIPFGYGRNIQAFVKGFGNYSHTSTIINTLLVGASTSGSNPSTGAIEVDDRSLIASKDTSPISVSITAEHDLDTNELVIYYNSSQNYHFNLYVEIEYNIIT